MPVPGDQDVMVRVVAASVNRADLDGLKPKPSAVRLLFGLRAPRNHRVGIDVAGVVEAVGAGVTRFAPGDRVFGDLFSFGLGAFADYACVPAEALATIPDRVSFEDAATLPHSAVLALQGLRLRNGRTPRPGDRVLVDGASGNVGPFAVQLAKLLGAHVTGVASASKLDLVRELGADEVIDYAATDYTRLGERWDWILAVDSHQPVLRVRHALRPGGVYVTLGGETSSILGSLLLGPVVGRATGRSVSLMLWWKPFDRADVARLLDLVASGSLRPVIDRRYGLDDVVQALRYVDDGHARGKVLVVP